MEAKTLEIIKGHFKLSETFLATARLAYEHDDVRTAVDRAHLAMHHAAAAALLSKGIVTKTHHGLIQQFGKTFIKPGLFDENLGQYLQKSFVLRQSGDYEIYAIIEPSVVSEILDKGAEFVEALKVKLGVS